MSNVKVRPLDPTLGSSASVIINDDMVLSAYEKEVIVSGRSLVLFEVV